MAEAIDKKALNWGTACHLIALIGFIGIPFGNLIGPLVIWLSFKNTYPNVDVQGKESLNFQISMSIYGIVAAVLCLILIGFVLLAVLVVADFILVIIAAIRASNGEEYKYPFTIRFIR